MGSFVSFLKSIVSNSEVRELKQLLAQKSIDFEIMVRDRDQQMDRACAREEENILLIAEKRHLVLLLQSAMKGEPFMEEAKKICEDGDYFIPWSDMEAEQDETEQEASEQESDEEMDEAMRQWLAETKKFVEADYQ